MICFPCYLLSIVKQPWLEDQMKKVSAATHTAFLEDLPNILPSADVVVLALALTPATYRDRG